jgi:phage-related holin
MNRFLQSILSLDALAKPANIGDAFTSELIGPIVTEAFRNGKFWTYFLLVAIIAADWITGIAAAKKDSTYSFEYGISGAMRTLLMLWIPFIGWLLDKVTLTVFGINKSGYAFFAITIMLAYYTWESMTANAFHAGWEKWIPNSVLTLVSSEIKAKMERAQRQNGERSIG